MYTVHVEHIRFAVGAASRYTVLLLPHQMRAAEFRHRLHNTNKERSASVLGGVGEGVRGGGVGVKKL
jgi:hypothetical protein